MVRVRIIVKKDTGIGTKKGHQTKVKDKTPAELAGLANNRARASWSEGGTTTGCPRRDQQTLHIKKKRTAISARSDLMGCGGDIYNRGHQYKNQWGGTRLGVSPQGAERLAKKNKRTCALIASWIVDEFRTRRCERQPHGPLRSRGCDLNSQYPFCFGVSPKNAGHQIHGKNSTISMMRENAATVPGRTG